MMRIISHEAATRTEHLPDCLGYEDCECFSERHRHADVYEMQLRIAMLKIALSRAREHAPNSSQLAAVIDAIMAESSNREHADAS